jgi:hypothetical protein
MSDHLKAVPLEHLVEFSQLVIVARPAEPREREELIDITPPDRERSPAFPPFLRLLRRFVVEAILWSEDADPAPGAVIEVDSASHDYDLGVHRKRFAENVSRITLHERYEPEEMPEPLSSSRLVFLRRRGDGWSFAVDPGEEGLGLRARVEKLLHDLRSRDR